MWKVRNFAGLLLLGSIVKLLFCIVVLLFLILLGLYLADLFGTITSRSVNGIAELSGKFIIRIEEAHTC